MEPIEDITPSRDEGGDAPCWAHLFDPDDRGGDDRIRIRRAYDDPAPDDGRRILVDRLWPRGVRRAELALDEWCSEIAPSDALRRWYGHQPERWAEFARRYRAELEAHDEVAQLAEHVAAGPVTLVCASRDVEHSNATVLRDVLLERVGHDPR